MKILTVIGARPQFIKAAMVSRAIRHMPATAHGPTLHETIVHTGQHYDTKMSRIFFEELEITPPAYNLEVGSGSHAMQTGKIIMRLEPVLIAEQPDLVLVYGDTNSTIAASLVAAKLHIPIGHVEAGLRSYNRIMPEEINRILTDRISTLLFCPTQTSVDILQQEGVTEGVHLTGDVMLDASLHYAAIAEQRSQILSTLHLAPKHYYVATIHRPANADNAERMQCILQALSQLSYPVVFPVHPRTRKGIETLLAQNNVTYDPSQLLLIPPVGYLDMLMLERHARVIITDSGGMQKEAYFFQVPCVTLRPETEWTETVEFGWNRLCNIVHSEILDKVRTASAGQPIPLFGDGQASVKIVDLLWNYLSQ
jgi:UDP-N-acetylglucosamine 2-epimerase